MYVKDPAFSVPHQSVYGKKSLIKQYFTADLQLNVKYSALQTFHPTNFLDFDAFGGLIII